MIPITTTTTSIKDDVDEVISDLPTSCVVHSSMVMSACVPVQSQRKCVSFYIIYVRSQKVASSYFQHGK